MTIKYNSTLTHFLFYYDHQAFFDATNLFRELLSKIQ